MELFAGALMIIGLVAAVLFAIGVPLVFGLLAWDVVDRARRERASAPASAPAETPAEIRYVAPASSSVATERLTA